MVFKSFRTICILRMIIFAATIYLFFYLFMETELVATTFIVGLLSAYQVFGLFHYIEKTNKDLSRFLDSIKYSDFSQSFTANVRGAAFRELNESFNNVIRQFQHERTERVEHFQYLQTVVEHVGVGLLAFRMDGEVELINKAAKKLLNHPHLRNVEQLSARYPQLAGKLMDLKQGKRDLIKIQEEDDILQLTVYATNFILHQQKYKLVSIQNIQSELEAKEMEAWQNLIRVLTHEIMNSITPISSLASTTSAMLPEVQTEKDPGLLQEIIKDIQSAIRTIQKRSDGLLKFVESYRQLTRIPKPNFEIIPVSELFRRLVNLSGDQFDRFHIEVETNVNPESLEITADPILIEQVLINLIKNAVEALADTEKPVLRLVSGLDQRGSVYLQVIDNGPGIKPEVQEKIFIPFFTTKKQGSGIGLSLSRQIMRLHGGSISVASIPGQETKFNLRF